MAPRFLGSALLLGLRVADGATSGSVSGPFWSVVSGSCVLTANGCITSPSFPCFYSSSSCEISPVDSAWTGYSLDMVAPMDISKGDVLMINGVAIGTNADLSAGLRPQGNVRWTVASNSTFGSGWKICPRADGAPSALGPLPSCIVQGVAPRSNDLDTSQMMPEGGIIAIIVTVVLVLGVSGCLVKYLWERRALKQVSPEADLEEQEVGDFYPKVNEEELRNAALYENHTDASTMTPKTSPIASRQASSVAALSDKAPTELPAELAIVELGGRSMTMSFNKTLDFRRPKSAPGSPSHVLRHAATSPAFLEETRAPWSFVPFHELRIPPDAIGDFPVYWQNRSKPCRDLVPTTAIEESVLQKLLDSTFNTARTEDFQRGAPFTHRLRIFQASRIENSSLWERYAMLRHFKLQHRSHQIHDVADHGGPLLSTNALTLAMRRSLFPSVNEAFLWYGTSPEEAQRISQLGFKMEYTGTKLDAMYGPASVFNECCSKADEYSTCSSTTGVYALLLCRAILGEPMNVGTAGAELEELEAGLSSQAYNSVLRLRESKQASATYREFAIYEESQVYPEFLILYKRI